MSEARKIVLYILSISTEDELLSLLNDEAFIESLSASYREAFKNDVSQVLNEKMK